MEGERGMCWHKCSKKNSGSLGAGQHVLVLYGAAVRRSAFRTMEFNALANFGRELEGILEEVAQDEETSQR